MFCYGHGDVVNGAHALGVWNAPVWPAEGIP